jgi:hypothetical protein
MVLPSFVVTWPLSILQLCKPCRHITLSFLLCRRGSGRAGFTRHGQPTGNNAACLCRPPFL